MPLVNTKTHTDIKPGLVEKLLPSALKPYARLARLDRPIGIWLLLLPGWWSVLLAAGGIPGMDARAWTIFGLFGIGAVVMRAAGCVVNDWWDRNLDRQVERTKLRPLASGEVTPKQALVFLFALLLAGLIILMQMNWFTVALGVLSLPLIAIYPLMKRFTWWPQLFLGVVFNFGALMGWSAVTGGLDNRAWLLYAGGIFWTLGYDTIYAHQDKDDDALVGIKSTARLFGKFSKALVIAFYIAAGILILKAGYIPEPHGSHLRSLLVTIGILMLCRDVLTWNSANPESSLRTFKNSRIFGLIVLLGMAVAR